MERLTKRIPTGIYLKQRNMFINQINPLGYLWVYADALERYEDLGTLEELAAALAELERYRATKMTPEEITKLQTQFNDLADGFSPPYKVRDVLFELKAYRAKGPVEELERVVRCGECSLYEDVGECPIMRERHKMRDYCSEGERREKV